MVTITKKELIDRITENTQAKRLLVKATIQNFLDEVISELGKGNRLEFIPGMKCYRSHVYSNSIINQLQTNLITWDGECFTCVEKNNKGSK